MYVFKAKIVTFWRGFNVCRYNSSDNYNSYDNIRNSGRRLKGPIRLEVFCILHEMVK